MNRVDNVCLDLLWNWHWGSSIDEDHEHLTEYYASDHSNDDEGETQREGEMPTKWETYCLGESDLLLIN